MPKHTTLTTLMAQLQQQHGAHALRPLSRVSALPQGLPTGFPSLDDLLACGGIPRRHTTLLAGQPTSGKTSLAYHVITQAQAVGDQVVYVDHDQVLDGTYASACGVAVEQLLVAYPDTAEMALDMVRDLLALPGVGLIVLDSGPVPPDALSRLRGLLARSQWTLVVLTDRLPSQFSGVATVLWVQRRAWQVAYGDVCGYQAVVQVLKDMSRSGGQSVELTFALPGGAA